MTLQSTSISTLSNEIIQSIENKDGIKNLIPTGFHYLDKEFGGLSLGELVVIGGRPSMGKSQLVISLVSNICDEYPILFFSFDLSVANCTARLLSNRTGIAVNKIIQNKLDNIEIADLKLASEKLTNTPLFISDSGLANINQIIEIIKEHVTTHHVKVVVIDYLQLLGFGKYNSGREAEIGNICRVLKMCAKELNIAILLLSQLSRSVETRGFSKKPLLADLRDSGSIEQLADKVWLLFRPEYYGIETFDDDENSATDCVLLLIIAKNKNGKIGESYFQRDSNFTKFTSIKFPKTDIDYDESRILELQNPFTIDPLENNVIPF